jgi:hypothetical protein
LPQIQFMAQVNQVCEHYILAMKCGDPGDLTDFIYFVEECLKAPTWTVVHSWQRPNQDLFPLQKYSTKEFWMTPVT